MNVIPIVFSILMLLAIITYAQLQNFVTRSVVRAEYVCYLGNRSRESVNEHQRSLYNSHQVPGNGRKQQSERTDADSRINLAIFEQEPTAENRIYYDAHTDIVKRLIEIIYGDRPFFQEFEETKPDIVNELWSEVTRELQRNHDQRSGIKKAKHLANLRLADPALQNFLAQMLKRVQTPESLTYDCPDGKTSPEYYPNLIDYITVKAGGMKPYRVWLAPPALLMAIFQDEAVVQAIVIEREQLYRQLGKESKEDREQLKNEMRMAFQKQFQNSLPSNIPSGIVNFDVSLTKPPKGEPLSF